MRDDFQRTTRMCYLVFVLCFSSAESKTDGIAVYKISAGTALGQSAIKANDQVTAWELLSVDTGAVLEQGRFDSPFDWEWFVREKSPLGKLRLTVDRDGVSHQFSFFFERWDVEMRPAS